MNTSNGITGSVRKWRRYPAYKDSGVEWYRPIPTHWTIKPTKHACSMNTESLGEATPPDYEMEYVDIGNVSSEGLILSTQRFRFENAPSRARKKVRHGDTIISTVRTYLKAIAHIADPAENLIVSTGFAVLQPNGVLDPRFLWRSVQAHEYVEKVVTHSTGIGYPAIPPTTLATLPLWVPPLDEQRQIVAFLDRQTARIDRLIAKKERLIELLQEKRIALISHAVTKGIDSTVPMKDSGVEWLGTIPAHWEVSRSKRVFRLRNEKAYESERQLTVSQERGVVDQEDFMASEGRRVVQVVKGSDILKHVEPNDFVISMRSFQGGIEWSRLRGSTSSAYVMLVPSAKVDCPFFAYLLKCKKYISALQNTSDLIRDGQALRYTNFCLVDLPLLPLAEQRTIAEYLNRETAIIDSLLAKVLEAIDKLHEYRTALISAAVTGKIDVRKEIV